VEVSETRVARVQEDLKRVIVGDALVMTLVDLIPDIAGGKFPPFARVTLAVDYLDERGETLADARVRRTLVVDPRYELAERLLEWDGNSASDRDLGWRGAEPEASGSEVDVGAFSRDANYEPSADEGDYG